jgi:hypothetical protein
VMNSDTVEKIANAVLYEGYMLYPYRPSAIKNRQRFNFGVLYPREYCETEACSDNWSMQTECLVLGSSSSTVRVKVRFLQLGEQQGWCEGYERDVALTDSSLESIAAQPLRRPFAFPAKEEAGKGRLESIEGELEAAASQLSESLFRITVTTRNCVALGSAPTLNRDEALLRSLISVHSILHVDEGEFASLLDPPESFRSAAAACQNIGTWPVLVGEEGARDTMLSAPIILYDYPQIAPESPGDLYDGTEIDEILALRILTMTDAEKLEVRNSDDRARKILERTEMMPPEHFQKLHGALRGLRGRSGETQ